MAALTVEALVQVTCRNSPLFELSCFRVLVVTRSFSGGELRDAISVTFQAADTIGPANRFKKREALLFSSEFPLDLYQARSDAGRFPHVQMMGPIIFCVKGIMTKDSVSAARDSCTQASLSASVRIGGG